MPSISLPQIFGQTHAQPLRKTNDEVVIYKGNALNIVVPKYALAPGSVQIAPHSNISQFSKWTEHHDREAYTLIQRTVHTWKKQGITHYMVYGKSSPDSPFCWEIVPYHNTLFSRIWQQLRVLWNITFGGMSYSASDRQKIADHLLKDQPDFSAPVVPKIVHRKKPLNDAFCNPDVINSQLVYEGKHMRLLYNYAPINIGEKLHFLLVPKRHGAKFSHLTIAEYLEGNAITRKLQAHYRKKGMNTTYDYTKTGTQAGQTVAHTHKHLNFTATKTQEFFGKLRVFRNMFWAPSPLRKEALQLQVKTLRKELSKLF
jgi:diadenosine tetraphosphate (Ap4A) HIT family hydrolase